jgi:hypothetical protein
MKRFHAAPFVTLGLAAVVALVSACEGFAFNTPGTITVRNLSQTETVVLAVLADDVKSYPTLAPGANALITTEIGGTYTVTVVMSAVDVQDYQTNLRTLKSNVQKVVDGTASNDEKVLFFTYLAGINAAIAQSHATGGASCSGKINLSEDESSSVAAQVFWQPTLGSGFWSLACSSN